MYFGSVTHPKCLLFPSKGWRSGGFWSVTARGRFLTFKIGPNPQPAADPAHVIPNAA
jgi:hypothetical protein